MKIAIWLLALILVSAPATAQFAEVGSLTFPTSARSEQAQNHFLRGVAILHSFGWKQAIEEFQAAQAIEPDFAMAYWGETLSYNHPLFGGGPRLDEENPRNVLNRLGPDRMTRLASIPTDREKGFLMATEALWANEGSYDDRRVSYMEAMERLYDQYPDDHEVATFYALSLLSGSRALGDQSLRLEVRAGTIAMKVFQANPAHPGAPHYMIHAFDDPIHAPLALEAAYRYAEIAPAVAHARHMPTHIFIQHGMWDLVSRQNQSAHDAALALWESGDSVGDAVHSLDWGQYGDLQRGDYSRSNTWINRLEALVEQSDRQQRAVSTLPLLRARHIVESEQWKIQPVRDDSTGHELLATGLSAIRKGDLSTARAVDKALTKLADDGQGEDKIARMEVAALLAASEGRNDDAIQLMDSAISLVETLRAPNGAASPVKPPYELYGELLLQLEQPSEALAKFTTALQRMPNRMRSLLGAARASSKIGDTAGARRFYSTIVEYWVGSPDNPAYKEAAQFSSN